jgi:hypothetical protein
VNNYTQIENIKRCTLQAGDSLFYFGDFFGANLTDSAKQVATNFYKVKDDPSLLTTAFVPNLCDTEFTISPC